MACQRGCWMKMMYRRTRFWRAESERAAGLVPALPVASSTLRTLGGHTPIVSKAGGVQRGEVLPCCRRHAAATAAGLPAPPFADGNLSSLGANKVTRAPTTTGDARNRVECTLWLWNS